MNDFLVKLSRIINSRQSRSVIMTGNIYDLFFDGDQYVPLIDCLSKRYSLKPGEQQRGLTQISYELNGEVTIHGDDGELSKAWEKFRKYRIPTSLKDELATSNGNPTFALELMRQLTICSRKSNCKNDLFIVIEGADMLIPEAEVSRMSIEDRKRVSIVHDWFSDPKFMNAHDTVILLSESRSLIHHRVAKLPQVLSVEVPYPNLEQRQHFLVTNNHKDSHLYENTAGLSIHAMRQLICSGDLSPIAIIEKVEEYISGQLGEDVVEFKKPSHKFDAVIGFTKVKEFMTKEMIPRLQEKGDGALPGAAIGGPIGGGKTFICEALAAELGLPVLVLKNIRSQWYGQTDVIFERLRRGLEALDKVVIFVDEADTQFGGVDAGTHETERRLTGKIQAMMSDPRLRGKVIWLLMTARIHQLSPDIRRPGRVGDLIIPILDPTGEDQVAFIKWCFGEFATDENMDKLKQICESYSAASYASLRSLIKALKCQTMDDVNALCFDIIEPDILKTRKYQTLQAMMNCTRMSLLPDEIVEAQEDEDIRDRRSTFEACRRGWREEIEKLELQGIR